MELELFLCFDEKNKEPTHSLSYRNFFYIFFNIEAIVFIECNVNDIFPPFSKPPHYWRSFSFVAKKNMFATQFPSVCVCVCVWVAKVKKKKEKKNKNKRVFRLIVPRVFKWTLLWLCNVSALCVATLEEKKNHIKVNDYLVFEKTFCLCFFAHNIIIESIITSDNNFRMITITHGCS